MSAGPRAPAREARAEVGQAAPVDATFPKRLRLRLRREFVAIQRGGRRLGTEHFTLHGRPNGGRPTRLGITVSRKVGKATVRNRVKRLLREAFRLNRLHLPVGFDVVVVARPGPLPGGLDEVARELVEAVGRFARRDERPRDEDSRRASRPARGGARGPSRGGDGQSPPRNDRPDGSRGK